MKDTKEGRETAFFTPLDPFGDEAEEEYDDLSKPRKVHYKNKWKVSQVAVYWVNVGKAHDKGLQFWQKRSHAIIFMIQYQLTALKKVVSPRGDTIFHQRISTPRPAPKIVLTKHGNRSMANFQAARNLVWRETLSTLLFVFKEFHKKNSA